LIVAKVVVVKDSVAQVRGDKAVVKDSVAQVRGDKAVVKDSVAQVRGDKVVVVKDSVAQVRGNKAAQNLLVAAKDNPADLVAVSPKTPQAKQFIEGD
jgi:nucleotide-binding universal stress UspA family protein